MEWVLVLLLCSKMAMAEEGRTEADGAAFAAQIEAQLSSLANRLTTAEWNYATNITEYNLQKKSEVFVAGSEEKKRLWTELIKYPWETFQNETLKRMFKKESILGSAILPQDKYKRLDEVTDKMQAIYSTAKICDFKNTSKCDLSLEPDLTRILAKSRDPEELKHVWTEWRNAVGPKCRELYPEYVHLSNLAATMNNLSDAEVLWNLDFEEEDFEGDMLRLWGQVEPFYKELHAYVRYRLGQFYGAETVPPTKPIPAHLLGNMWAQTWNNVFDLVRPFPTNKPDLTASMNKLGYTPVKMFQVAEEFFASINMSRMTEEFWNNSVLEKPKDREIVCHASAWDFSDKTDFRIKQCTRVDFEDLQTVHHEMGHIEYYMEYKDQPFTFREGANSGFHEAVGDVIGLSVSSAEYQHRLGLVESEAHSTEDEVNALMEVALSKVAFLPFGLLTDLWRWGLFKNRTSPQEYNAKWWQLRRDYQGVEAPVERTEQDFDPAAKYHIVADVPYIRYFVSHVLQFQLQKALCETAGQYKPSEPSSKPLHQCTIYNSKEAGNKLKGMLALGSSKDWREALSTVTGSRQLEAAPLLEYFAPLRSFLAEQNAKNKQQVGWN